MPLLVKPSQIYQCRYEPGETVYLQEYEDGTVGIYTVDLSKSYVVSLAGWLQDCGACQPVIPK